MRGFAGPYDITPDWNPIIGPCPGIDGLYLAVGWSGHGFKLSPAVGEVVAAEVSGRTPPIDVGELRPERFAEGRLLRLAYGPGASACRPYGGRGRRIVGRGLGGLLGVAQPDVAVELLRGARLRPAQVRRDQRRDRRRGGAAAVGGLDRDARAPREDVVQVERALVGDGVHRLGRDVADGAGASGASSAGLALGQRRTSSAQVPCRRAERVRARPAALRRRAARRSVVDGAVEPRSRAAASTASRAITR